jgi:hypothetical protein
LSCFVLSAQKTTHKTKDKQNKTKQGKTTEKQATLGTQDKRQTKQNKTRTTTLVSL